MPGTTAVEKVLLKVLLLPFVWGFILAVFIISCFQSKRKEVKHQKQEAQSKGNNGSMMYVNAALTLVLHVVIAVFFSKTCCYILLSAEMY